MAGDDAISLREVAERMDPEKPARRLYGNGPPFDPDREEAYDPDDLGFPMVVVTEDGGSADPPKRRSVEGPIDVELLYHKTTYQPEGHDEPIQYLDTVSARLVFTDDHDGVWYVSSDDDSSGTFVNNLFWADFDAYDLGMINRTPENEAVPEGYTDKGLVENHRWVDPEEADSDREEWRSIRNVVDRHRDGVRHRLLWQNMELPLDTKVFRRKAVAENLGSQFGESGFDVVGVCEVPAENLLGELRKGYARSYEDVDSRHHADLGVVVGGQRGGEDTLTRNVTWKEAKKYDRAGPGGTKASKEGWMRTVIEVASLPGNPKFEVFVTHLQAQWGAWIDRAQQTKLSQMRELRDEIAERNDEKPNQPKIVMGDFNIHSQNGGYDGVPNAQYFGNFMQQMRSVGMQDVWLTYGGPGPANSDCNLRADNSCDPFVPKDGESRQNYYRGNRLDYVFVEKPRPEHDVHVDVSRATNVTWTSEEYDHSPDHVGVAFDVVTSPTD